LRQQNGLAELTDQHEDFLARHGRFSPSPRAEVVTNEGVHRDAERGGAARGGGEEFSDVLETSKPMTHGEFPSTLKGETAAADASRGYEAS